MYIKTDTAFDFTAILNPIWLVFNIAVKLEPYCELVIVTIRTAVGIEIVKCDFKLFLRLPIILTTSFT